MSWKWYTKELYWWILWYSNKIISWWCSILAYLLISFVLTDEIMWQIEVWILTTENSPLHKPDICGYNWMPYCVHWVDMFFLLVPFIIYCHSAVCACQGPPWSAHSMHIEHWFPIGSLPERWHVARASTCSLYFYPPELQPDIVNSSRYEEAFFFCIERDKNIKHPPPPTS